MMSEEQVQHLSFRLSLHDARTDQQCSGFASGLTLDMYRAALLAICPTARVNLSEVSAVSEDVAPSESKPVVSVHFSGLDVRSMHELRDQVLSGDFDTAMSRELPLQGEFNLRADRSEFAAQYEQSVLMLDTLTSHQREKVEECTMSGDTDVHLKAPAGAGKTFVALHRVLDALRVNPSCYVLFIARNEALAHFAASWLGKRVCEQGQRRHILNRFHVLHEPLDAGVHAVMIRGNRVCMKPASCSEPYYLLVVDEAHHLYADAAARGLIESFVTVGVTRRLLLSDYSQSLGRGIVYPSGLKDVLLSEVVRCSQRIVAGAMAFQLGGEEKLLTKCHHESTGPPLRSFLFDIAASQGADKRTLLFEAYAEHCARALGDVVAAFPSFNLHNRLALVVPDDEFLEGLRPELVKALGIYFPNRRLQLVSATVASSDLGFPRLSDDGDTTEVESESMAEDMGEWFVYDTISQMDGLERLIVVGIGLDSVISAKDAACPSHDSEDNGPAVLETRSKLYRAITRAHLMVLIVNEFLRGGWLEFLGSVRLRNHEAFDRIAELKRSELQAVDVAVKEDLTMAVAATAQQQGLSLDDKAMTTLAKAVTAMQEHGLPMEAAVDRALQGWASAAKQALDALKRAAALVAGEPAFQAINGPEIDDAIAAPVILALYKAEIVNLPAAALEEVRKAYKTRRDTQAKVLLQAAISLAGADVPDSAVLAVLQSLVVRTAELNQDLEAAARQVVHAWVQIEAQVKAALQTSSAALQTPPPDGILGDMLTSAIAAALQHAESAQAAVNDEIQKWKERQVDEHVTKALNEQSQIAHTVCRAGARVRLVNLKTDSLIGKEGTLVHFIDETGRWSARVDDRKMPVSVKPVNLEVLNQEPHFPSSLSDVMSTLKAAVYEELASSGNSTSSSPELDRIGTAAAAQVLLWRTFEGQVSSALEEAALANQLHLGGEAKDRLVQQIVQNVWQLKSGVDLFSQGEDRHCPFHMAVQTALSEWERGERVQQEESSQITSAIEAAASAERLLLTDAAAATLQRRVLAMLRRGLDIQAAVSAAIREWHQQVIRKQVQQTVWDPSGNSTRKVTGVVRFMPFKSNGAEFFDSFVLSNAFALLPFHEIGAFSRVCKRWRSIASDPSWKPELVVYAWGDADVTGLSVACPKPTLLDFSLSKQIVKITCADSATFALTASGNVWFWGTSWLQGVVEDCEEPILLNEMRDVVSVAASPPGYYHGRSRRRGYTCAAITRQGSLYTWGLNGELLHEEGQVQRPKRVSTYSDHDVWYPAAEPVLLVTCGLDYIALCIKRTQGVENFTTSVLTCGSWMARGMWMHSHIEMRRQRSQLKEVHELRGVALRQLEAGSFHCCALSTSGDLYSWGHPIGNDHANGNLLGSGLLELEPRDEPRRVAADGLGPVAEVACSTYSTIAITIDGRVFSWGDCDGDALGHTVSACHSPVWLPSLRWQRVTHGKVAYTNAAVATDEGRVFVWGGNCWEGGIAENRHTQGPSEVKWNGVPSCYRCNSVALAHRHGFLIFRKEP